MNGPRLAFGTMLLLLTPLPMAAAQADEPTGALNPASVTFYGHMFGAGLGTPMPANTEFPNGEANFGLGFLGVCSDVDPTFQVAGDCSAWEVDYNKLAFFSTAGFVDVQNADEFNGEGGYALLHNERGQTKDIVLDMTKDVSASVYFSIDFHGWPVQTTNDYPTNCAYPHPPDLICVYPSWGWDPGVVPNMVVDAFLYSAKVGEHAANASDAPPIAEALFNDQATLIAQGRWGPDQVMNGLPGSPNVNEFVVNLGKPRIPVIPREHDFFIVFSMYMDNGPANSELGRMRYWSGEFFPPTFTIPVLNPIQVERVIPTFAHGKLAVLGVLNTPWGSYDVAPDGVEITFEDEAGRVVEPRSIERFGKFSVGHGGHYLPINFTWVWNHNADRLPPGTYTVTVRAANFQHSAQAECSATFTVLPPEGRGQLPRPGPVREGACGETTATVEQLAELRQRVGGGTNDRGPSDPLDALDAPGTVRIASSDTSAATPLWALLMVPALAGAALVRRRAEP